MDPLEELSLNGRIHLYDLEKLITDLKKVTDFALEHFKTSRRLLFQLPSSTLSLTTHKIGEYPSINLRPKTYEVYI